MLEPAGFGGTPDEIDRTVALGVRQAVAHLARPQRIANAPLAAFDPLGIAEAGIDAVSQRRPPTTEQAKQCGAALGVKVKPTAKRPLDAKMALYWHGHFATPQGKVRGHRKMRQPLEPFQRQRLGNFCALMIGAAQNPAMRALLGADVKVKGAANENAARQILEMFTMAVGPYSGQGVREAARAFSGRNSSARAPLSTAPA